MVALQLEVIASFCYPGDIFSAGGGCETTAKSCHLSYKTHGHVYSSCSQSAMLHASKAWPLTKTNLQRLQGYDQTDLQYQARGCGHGKVKRATGKARD